MADAWGGSFGSDPSGGSCSTGGVCGTGGWSGPKPGDPSTNSVLSAVSAYGGVDIHVQLPTTNSYAVSKIILYRGKQNNFNLATKRTTFSGDFFYDRIAKEDIQLYYYWIVILSNNGTYGDPIGPASAIPMGLIAEVIGDLTGQIDRGVLAQSLKTEIDRITTIDGGLSQEVIDRLAQNAANAAALADLAANVDSAITLLASEVTVRETADEALVDSINVMYASLGDSAAAITEESSVRAAADTAIASRITTAESTLYGDVASGQVALTTTVEGLDGKVTDIGALYTAKVQVNGLIGGFGVYNNGDTVEAGFDVDTFWIGRTGPDKCKPFIVSGGVVYINEAAIEKLTFSKLRDEAGTFIVQNGKVKAAYIDAENLDVGGQVNVGDFTGYTWPAAGGTGAHLSANGLLMGNPNASPGNPGGKYLQVHTPIGGVPAIYTNIPAYLEDLQVDTIKIKDGAVTSFSSWYIASISDYASGSFYVGFIPYGWTFMFVITASTGLGAVYDNILADGVYLGTAGAENWPGNYTFSYSGSRTMDYITIQNTGGHITSAPLIRVTYWKK